MESIAEQRTAVLEVPLSSAVPAGMELACSSEMHFLTVQIVGVLLTRHVLLNYTEFVKGIDDIAVLETELQTAYAKVKETRTFLGSSRKEVELSLRVARAVRSKSKSSQILDVAQKLQRIHGLQEEVRYMTSCFPAIRLPAGQSADYRLMKRSCATRRMVSEGEFAPALLLCVQSFAWLQQLGTVHIAAQLTERVDQLYVQTTSLLGMALHAACANFTPEAYSKV